jgi:hypothetical protein
MALIFHRIACSTLCASRVPSPHHHLSVDSCHQKQFVAYIGKT